MTIASSTSVCLYKTDLLRSSVIDPLISACLARNPSKSSRPSLSAEFSRWRSLGEGRANLVVAGFRLDAVLEWENRRQYLYPE